ncbi:MAG: cob(I)yrinic acid a,c-diamide adenosyltransferase, partial [Gammaproteobacteria bacterium]|nr:cob(I)yrinic acid a,c-diamide adenosyltransferase [Gammaproteobacteria bacterium]
MGNRLSKIYTRTGDEGTTGLGDGTRVPKDDLRVEAYGTVDELNSAVGMILAEKVPDDIMAVLDEIQHELFDLGSELCMPGYEAIKDEHITALEDALDGFNAELPPLKEFILPGGGRAAAACHMARTVCRRAERRVFTLAQRDEINPAGLKYLNRLSDLLFVMARVLARHENGQEVLWRSRRTK